MKRLLLDGCLCKHDPSLVSTQIGEHLWHFKRAANLGQQYVLCIVSDVTYIFKHKFISKNLTERLRNINFFRFFTIFVISTKNGEILRRKTRVEA